MSGPATERVSAAYARLDERRRPEAWITIRPREEVLAEAAAADAAPPRPLSGRVIAVKDNIDVAGLPTTAGCPAFAYTPSCDAAAVARLRSAGAIVIGKTNLDQFATGLVGARSPYGAVRDATRSEYVSGGSSSGSAVAVALEIVDAALGTDTAGSGRIPAAFQGIVGIKPTRGLVSTHGVVPACRTLDCVSVLAKDPSLAQELMWTMVGDETASRGWPADAPLGAPQAPRIAVPDHCALAPLSEAARQAFAAAMDRLRALGMTISEVDLEPFLAAGRLLYGGAFLAERHAAVGGFVASHRDAVDPTVGEIIESAASLSATALVNDIEALERLAMRAAAALAGADALLLPTVGSQPTLAEVAADRIAVNAELGRYTTFVNLLDMCAVALPAGTADGGHFGVSLAAAAFGDRVLDDLAARFCSEDGADGADCTDSPGAIAAAGHSPAATSAPRGIALFAVGAHRRGQPLNHQLTEIGARFAEVAHTSAAYRLYALDTTPEKPGLVRVPAGGVAIEGELWDVPPARVGPFLAALPRPMTLGQVTLDDGREVVGFACEPAALNGAPDISAYGSWTAYLKR